MLNNKAPAYVDCHICSMVPHIVIPSGTGSLFIVYTSRNRMQVEKDPESANKVLKNVKYAPILMVNKKKGKM